jgi:hypothetical protein
VNHPRHETTLRALPATMKTNTRRRALAKGLAVLPAVPALATLTYAQTDAQAQPADAGASQTGSGDSRAAPQRVTHNLIRPWAGRTFGESIGLQVKFYQGQPQATLGTLRELGVRWVREEFHWHELEPRAGEFIAFPNAFVDRLAFYRQHGIGVLFLLAYSNVVAYPDTSEEPHRSIDPEAFGRYVAEVTRRLRTAGVRFVLEVWNEPHFGELQRKLGGSWQGAAADGRTAPWVQHYIRIVEAARDAARAVEPRVRILAQDDMWIVHYWFLEAGLPKDIDGLSVHPYQPRPERAAVDADTPWTQPFQVVDADGSFRSAVQRLRAQAQRRWRREPAIWISEVGWILPHPGAKFPASPELQAAYLPRIYIGAFVANVEVTCWYSAFDVFDEGPWGLMDKQGKPRAAMQSMKTMASLLSTRPLLGQLAGVATPTEGLHAVWFGRRTGEQCVVLWSADDRSRAVELPCAHTVLNDGSAGLMMQPQGPLRRIEVGAAPVYVLGSWRGPELRRQLAGVTG